MSNSSRSSIGTEVPAASSTKRRRVLWIGPYSATSAAEADALQSEVHQIATRWQEPGEPLGKLDGAGTVVVAGDARLCGDLLHGFAGRVIYRSYGERVGLGEEFWASGARRLIEAGRPITFVTDADLSRMPLEEEWIAKRAFHAPRWLEESDDSLCERWMGGGSQVLVPVPSAEDDPDDRLVRQFADHYFSDDGYDRLPISSDPARLRTSEDHEGGLAARHCAAAISLFPQPGVLPYPLLRLVLMGVPMIYFPGCFLAHCIGPGGPGEIATIEEGRRLARRVSADRSHAAKMVQAQLPLASAWNPKRSRETYLRVMRDQLDDGGIAVPPGAASALAVGSKVGEQALRLAYDFFESADRELIASEGGATRLIRTLYNVLLEREPDGPGLAHHTARLRTDNDLLAIAREMLGSDEFRNKQGNQMLAWLRS